MLLVQIINLIRGYVEILVEGYFYEKFINICTRRHIYLWNIKKVGSCAVKMNISIKGFKGIRPVAKKTKCRVTVLHKSGIPFFMYRHRKRKTFVIGTLLFAGLLGYMTSFVWVIDIKGNDHIPSNEIVENLKQSGLQVGQIKFGIHTDEIQNQMMLRENRLAWIGVEIKGTKAFIEIKERREPPQIIENHIPCNIVANKDGVVKEMIVKSGQPVVKLGDTVSKGQLLVSGLLESKVQGVRYAHSTGSVKARTWLEKTQQVPLYHIKKTPTGNKISRYSIIFLGNEINLYINSGIPYANYDKISYNNELKMGENYYIPIAMRTDVYNEVTVEEENRQLEQAITEEAEKLRQQMLKELTPDAQVLNQNVEHVFIDEKNIQLKLTLECLEEIGMQEQIFKE